MISIEPLKLHPRFCHVLSYERKWLCIQYHCKRSAKGRMNQKSSALYWQRILPLLCAICENWTLENNCCNPQLNCLFWNCVEFPSTKLDMVTRNVRPSFTVLSFTDSQLLTQNIRAKIAAAKFWHLPVWLGSFFLLLGAGCHARTFWGRAGLPGWKDWSWSPRCPG